MCLKAMEKIDEAKEKKHRFALRRTQAKRWTMIPTTQKERVYSITANLYLGICLVLSVMEPMA